jgi:hypothetical protein
MLTMPMSKTSKAPRTHALADNSLEPHIRGRARSDPSALLGHVRIITLAVLQIQHFVIRQAPGYGVGGISFVLLRPQKWVTSLILRFAESIALPFARVLCMNGSGRGCIYS